MITRMASKKSLLRDLPQQLEICQILELRQRIKVEQIQKFSQKDNTRRFRWKQCLETMYMQVKKLREPVEATNL